MSKNKDWDEDLKARNGKEAIPASEHPRMEHMKMRCRELMMTGMYCDKNCKDLFYSKGYIVKKTFTRLKYLLGKADQSVSVEEKQQHLFNMSKIAIAFCVSRNIQLENEANLVECIKRTFKTYLPHQDKKNSVNQMLDLKEYFSNLEKTFTDKDTFTRVEIEGQCHSMQKFAMMCLRLDGAIAFEAEVQNKESMEMTM